jgi:hypothetical protein
MFKKGHVMSDEAKAKISLAQKGKLIPQEERERISRALMGHPVSPETREKIRQGNLGKKNPHPGYICSEETRRKRSQTEMGHLVSAETRAKMSAWQKGTKKTLSERVTLRGGRDYMDWQEAVFKRDGCRCQKCGKKDKKLNAHHLWSFLANEDLRFNVDNGVTLCRKCHIRFHSMFGNKDNTPYQFQIFMFFLKEDMGLTQVEAVSKTVDGGANPSRPAKVSHA